MVATRPREFYAHYWDLGKESMMTSTKTTLVAAAFCMIGAASAAAPVTVDFSTDASGVTTYTDDGATFEATDSPSFSVSSGYGLYFTTPGAAPEGVAMTTGGLFDLLSVDISHIDTGEPLTFTGLRNGSTVAMFSQSAYTPTINFTGFTGLDRLLITNTGSIWTDAAFENLVYETSGAAVVPVMGALPFLATGLASFLGFRRLRGKS